MIQKEEEVKKPIFAIERVLAGAKVCRMQWTKNYDEHLMLLVKEYKKKGWPKISLSMSKKFPEARFTSKKCQARWKSSINPELKRTYLSDSEELLLTAYHSSYKNKWPEISSHFPQRHNNILRNTFYSMLRKLVKRIHLEKHSVHAIDPLTFFQHLYFSCFLIELLSLADESELKNDIAPLYIFRFVKDSKINIDLCRQYALKCKDRLIFSNPSRLIMKRIENCCFDYLSKDFFTTAVRMIHKNVTSSSSISKDYLLDLFEHVIQLTPPTITSKSTMTSSAKQCRYPRYTFQPPLIIRRTMEIEQEHRLYRIPNHYVDVPIVLKVPKYML